MKVAIIHYWLVKMRGGEKVLEAILDLFPDADVFTHVVDRGNISGKINAHLIRTTWIAKIPFAKRYYTSLLPAMPLALENIDLTGYDLVISSESGPAKGIIPAPDALHICYCHSPMRYCWDHYHHYLHDAGLFKRLFMPLIFHRLRQWDVSTAARVDYFVANSSHVAARIHKYYRRNSVVVHPPVDIAEFSQVRQQVRGDFYLLAGELVSYKRADIAIEAFNRSGRKLLVIGEGAKLKQLRQKAKSNINFAGRVSGEELRKSMSACRALIFPGEEDFGIIPVEAMAAGAPVIAYGRGGARDTVVEEVTGLFFDEQTAESLETAVTRFEAIENKFSRETIAQHASGFSRDRFKREFLQVVRDAWISEARQKSRAPLPKVDSARGDA